MNDLQRLFDDYAEELGARWRSGHRFAFFYNTEGHGKKDSCRRIALYLLDNPKDFSGTSEDPGWAGLQLWTDDEVVDYVNGPVEDLFLRFDKTLTDPILMRRPDLRVRLAEVSKEFEFRVLGSMRSYKSPAP